MPVFERREGNQGIRLVSGGCFSSFLAAAFTAFPLRFMGRGFVCFCDGISPVYHDQGVWPHCIVMLRGQGIPVTGELMPEEPGVALEGLVDVRPVRRRA